MVVGQRFAPTGGTPISTRWDTVRMLASTFAPMPTTTGRNRGWRVGPKASWLQGVCRGHEGEFVGELGDELRSGR